MNVTETLCQGSGWAGIDPQDPYISLPPGHKVSAFRIILASSASKIILFIAIDPRLTVDSERSTQATSSVSFIGMKFMFFLQSR